MNIIKAINMLNIKEAYCPMLGTVKIVKIIDDKIYVEAEGTLYTFSKDGTYLTEECCLFPTKEMRDWSKLDWSFGDILVSDRFHCIFIGWSDSSKKTFIAKYHDYDYSAINTIEYTNRWKREDRPNKSNQYIKDLENYYDGKYVGKEATVYPTYYFDKNLRNTLLCNVGCILDYLDKLKTTCTLSDFEKEMLETNLSSLITTSKTFKNYFINILSDFKKELNNANT